MIPDKDSRAVRLANIHAEAWTNHDYETAKKMLSNDVKVDVTSTQVMMKETHGTGIVSYMQGLVAFGDAIIAGTGRVIAATGDANNSLILLTVEADFGYGKVTIPAARLGLWDEHNKLKSEQVIFFALSD